MKKIFSLILFLGLALELNSAIFAQGSNPENSQEKMNRQNQTGKMRDGRGDRSGMMRGLEGLNLTDAQKQQIQNLRRNNQSGEASRDEVRRLMQIKRAGTLTAEQENRLASLREQSKANSAKMREQILAILTPEQRQQFQQRNQGGMEREGEKMRAGENHKSREGAMHGDLEGLNLTDTQKEQLRNLRTGNRPNNATRQEMRELKEAKRNGTLTAAQENQLKLFKQQKKAESEQRHQQILAILTPEQRRQLEQNKAQRKEQMKQRRQNGTQNPPTNNNN